MTEANMADIGRRELLMLLIGLDEKGLADGSVSGITRLQKLLFLFENEGKAVAEDPFAFEPYKAGPYSPKVYDDLELLENLGLIKTEPTAESSLDEKSDIDRLTFDDLIGGFEEIQGARPAADSFEERKFYLTAKGKRRVEELLMGHKNDDTVSGIRRIKSKYSRYSLHDLLRYVYTKYPEMTTESEIVDQVLGSRS
jgi:uncharacterized protein YwgA